MAISQSVQFADPNAVMKAYLSRDVPAWSIWQRGQFMFKYEGKDVTEGAELLLQHLEILKQSAAIYTLKVYEDLPKNAKIKSNTPDDGSFNFRFVESPFSTGGYSGGNNALQQELTALRLKVEQLESEKEENDEPDDSLGVVGKVLALPGMAEAVAGVVPMLMGKIFGAVAPAPPAQSLAGVPGRMTLGEALEILQAKDPLFEDHIVKLAMLARDKPEQFTQVIAMMRFI